MITTETKAQTAKKKEGEEEEAVSANGDDHQAELKVNNELLFIRTIEPKVVTRLNQDTLFFMFHGWLS